MNKTIAAIIEREIARAHTQSQFAMLQRLVEALYSNEVLTDFDRLCDLKTQIGVSYIEWLESNETEENK